MISITQDGDPGVEAADTEVLWLGAATWASVSWRRWKSWNPSWVSGVEMELSFGYLTRKGKCQIPDDDAFIR